MSNRPATGIKINWGKFAYVMVIGLAILIEAPFIILWALLMPIILPVALLREWLWERGEPRRQAAREALQAHMEENRKKYGHLYKDES